MLVGKIFFDPFFCPEKCLGPEKIFSHPLLPPPADNFEKNKIRATDY